MKTLLTMAVLVASATVARANEHETKTTTDSTHYNVALFMAATFQANGGLIAGGEGGLCFEGSRTKFAGEFCGGVSYDSHHAVGGVLAGAFYRRRGHIAFGGGLKLAFDHPTKPEPGHASDLLAGLVTANLAYEWLERVHLYLELGAGVQGPVGAVDPKGHEVGPLFAVIGGIAIPLGPVKHH